MLALSPKLCYIIAERKEKLTWYLFSMEICNASPLIMMLVFGWRSNHMTAFCLDLMIWSIIGMNLLILKHHCLEINPPDYDAFFKFDFRFCLLAFYLGFSHCQSQVRLIYNFPFFYCQHDNMLFKSCVLLIFCLHELSVIEKYLQIFHYDNGFI